MKMDLMRLPPEVLVNIFLKLNGNELKNSRSVCKDWNDFLKQWIWNNKTSLRVLRKKLKSNWMNVKARSEETRHPAKHPCKQGVRWRWSNNLLAVANDMFVMNLDQTYSCGIFVGDNVHEHRVGNEDGGSHGLITEKLILIAHASDDPDNDPWSRWDIIERLENGEIAVRATNQKFKEQKLKCDREYFVIQENDEEAEEEKLLSLYKLENGFIMKVYTEDIAANYKLLRFDYPYIVLYMKKKRAVTGREHDQECLTIMKIDANDKFVHHTNFQWVEGFSVGVLHVQDAVYIKDHLIILEHGYGRILQESTQEWLRIININTGTGVSDQLVPTDDPKVLSWSYGEDVTHSQRVCIS